MDVRGQLCYSDAYARTIVARVAAVDDSGDASLVVLDRTVFYPGGGGQPSDRGLLLRASDGRSWTVRAARKSGGDIVHELEPSPAGPPARDDVVTVDLDWARRYALMRTHTALHALCGVVWRDYGALVTGGNMEPGGGRMDFEFERMSGDLVDAIEATVNRELAHKRDVRVNVLPRAEAFAIPDLIRTKINLLPEGITEIRTIEIVGLDLQADGGTHVSNTSEVGSIRVTGYESKGRINKRIRLELVDPEGWRAAAEERRPTGPRAARAAGGCDHRPSTRHSQNAYSEPALRIRADSMPAVNEPAPTSAGVPISFPGWMGMAPEQSSPRDYAFTE